MMYVGSNPTNQRTDSMQFINDTNGLSTQRSMIATVVDEAIILRIADDTQLHWTLNIEIQ